ncbi:MAG: PilW family protein [Proteobacteria bacterium]|nr:PilW family protein [Pseudomonadota bacterium]
MKLRSWQAGPCGTMGGFSLVELMVALTLSLILTVGALSILYSTKLTSAENERISRVQEAGRTAFELIIQDTRAAGYTGCAHPLIDKAINPPTSSLTNGLNSSTTVLWNFAQPVYGFEATSTTAWTPTLTTVPASPAATGGSDVLVLRAARPGSPTFRTNATFAANADIPVAADPNVTSAKFPTPVPVIISDCQGAAVFLATGFNPGANATIQHAAGAGTPGNANAALNRSFGINALVQPVQTVIYYVASCSDNTAPCTGVSPPALWRKVGSNDPQEVIQGVEAMQIKYGVDTDSDLLADQYVTADNVTDWGSVVSINLAILVRSIDQTGVEKDKQTYKLLGGTAAGGGTYSGFNDRRQRSVFTTTITLRNVTT